MNRKRHQTTLLHFWGTMNAICHLMKRSMCVWVFASTYKQTTWCGWFFNIISRSNNNNEGCALRRLNRIRIRTDANALNWIEKPISSLSFSAYGPICVQYLLLLCWIVMNAPFSEERKRINMWLCCLICCRDHVRAYVSVTALVMLWNGVRS